MSQLRMNLAQLLIFIQTFILRTFVTDCSLNVINISNDSLNVNWNKTTITTEISDPVEVKCPYFSYPPSDVMVDPKTVTPHSFEIHWNPPKNVYEFDGYLVCVDTLNKNETILKIKHYVPREYLNVSIRTNPGRTHRISVVTLYLPNHTFRSQYISVTTPPLPVLNLKASPGNNSDIFVEWSSHQNITQDSYKVSYGLVDLAYSSNEITYKLTKHLIGLQPGYNYSIRVVAISNGILSQTSLIVYQSTRPLKPIFFEIKRLSENDLKVSWSFNYNTSKKEYFHIVWTRIDKNETRGEINIRNNNFTHIKDVYPGAKYLFKIFSVKYQLRSESDLRYYTVEPRSPTEIKLIDSTDTLIFIEWSPPKHSLVEYYIIKIRFSNRNSYEEYDKTTNNYYFINNLKNAKYYAIKVVSFSNCRESIEDDADEIRLPLYSQSQLTLDPLNDLMFNPKTLTSYSIEIHWNPMKTNCDFDAYKVSVDTLTETYVSKWDRLSLIISKNIKPGKTYLISVVTVSYSVPTSQPKQVLVTTPPLPVLNISATVGKVSEIFVEWIPDHESTQDSFEVSYYSNHLVNISNTTFIVSKLNIRITHLMLGYNYSIIVWSISNQVKSKTPLITYQSLCPLEPTFEKFEPLPVNELNVSWSFNINISKREYLVIFWSRFDINEEKSEKTKDNYIHVKNLKPGAKYSFSIYSFSNNLVSNTQKTNYTVEPRSPTNITIVHGTKEYVYITWSIPSDSLIDFYRVKLRFPRTQSFDEYYTTNNTYYIFYYPKYANECDIKIVSSSNGKESIHNHVITFNSSNLVMENPSIVLKESNTITIYKQTMLGSIITIVIVIILILVSIGTFLIVNKMRKSDIEPEHNLSTFYVDSDLIVENDNNEHANLISKIDRNIRIEITELIIKNEIGHGQFATVYLGQLTSNSRIIEVAVKRLNSVPDQNYFDDYLREAIIMKQFDHDNVLNLIGVTVDDRGSPLIVTPFMNRGDLHSYLVNTENNPNVNQLIKFGIDVSKGMEYLSKKGLVHRDLAARNCMLDNNLCAKVADFGLTRDINEKNYYRSNPNKRQPLPIRWMAIESIEKLIFNKETDVWSYGVLMWEVFTRGVKPYPNLIGNNEVLPYLKSGHRLEKPDFCPKIIYETLSLCWDIRPQHRPTFAQLSQCFERIFADTHKLFNFDKIYYNNPITYRRTQY